MNTLKIFVNLMTYLWCSPLRVVKLCSCDFNRCVFFVLSASFIRETGVNILSVHLAMMIVLHRQACDLSKSFIECYYDFL